MNRFERGLWRKDGTVAVTQKDDTAQVSGSKRKRKKKTKKWRLLGKEEMAGTLGEQRDSKLEHALLEKLHIELCEKDQGDMERECYETTRAAAAYSHRSSTSSCKRRSSALGHMQSRGAVRSAPTASSAFARVSLRRSIQRRWNASGSGRRL
jgi:hypothetical protein